MGQALLGFDIPGIKAYVFGTGRLREIRGGSACLDHLNRQVIPSEVQRVAPSASLVFAGGGRGQFRLDGAEVERATTAIRRAVRQFTDVDPRIAAVPLDGPERDALSLLVARLRVVGGWPPPFVVAPSHSLLLPCRSCGIRPATVRDQEPDGTERPLCAVCLRKVKQDRAIKRALKDGRWPGLWEALAAPPALDQLRGRERPEDLPTLTRDEPLAILYADGDGMGRLFGTVDSIAEMTRRSEVVAASLVEAVREAIAGPLSPKPDETNLPFDVLLLGGDDLVIATTASRAFPAAALIAERFHTLASERIGRPASISIGIAIARASYPVAVLVDIAEGALRYAKKTRRQRQRTAPGQPVPGFIAFAIIHGPGQTDFAALAADWEAVVDQPPVRRALGALDPAGLTRAIAVARRLADGRTLARTKLQRLAEIAALPPPTARLEARLLYARCSTAERAALNEALRDLAAGQHLDFPYYTETNDADGRRLVAPWPDLADLATIIRRAA